VVFLVAIGLPFNHDLVWLYVLSPGLLTWLITRPYLENKRLPGLGNSQFRYFAKPKATRRMTLSGTTVARRRTLAQSLRAHPRIYNDFGMDPPSAIPDDVAVGRPLGLTLFDSADGWADPSLRTREVPAPREVLFWGGGEKDHSKEDRSKPQMPAMGLVRRSVGCRNSHNCYGSQQW